MYKSILVALDGSLWAESIVPFVEPIAGALDVRAKGLLMAGRPHERIAQAARRKRADLVVIGTHGRTGLARFVLGSVASRVLAIAPCPLLTVRGK